MNEAFHHPKAWSSWSSMEDTEGIFRMPCALATRKSLISSWWWTAMF
ncbi:hypothetical protein MUK42_14144 [Musa troglodytarum]|uniref:Uncharacterized protein n=1 Tax=Musa troglodytarum TaxID=320322 RepID=A0A9E7H653_9LILI|nr:hypothetical protein MUK42_14144 [Musa troglodytarum]